MTEIRAQYYVKKEDGLVHCLLCPHNCHIKNNKRGICRVRINIDGDLYAETYGQISSLALDPIEKKPLYNFYPGSYILSVGSYGCNFSCSFCQNNGISFGNPQTTYISPEILVDKAFSLKDSGNIGLAYTYNEPFISYEYVLDCCRLIKEKKMKNVLITNGYVQNDPLLELLPYVDAMNVDLKSFSPDFYQKICNGRVEHVKDTIRLAANKCHVEVTCLVIPGLNDSPEEIEAMSVWLSQLSPEIPLHLTRFFPRYKMLDKESTSKTVLIKLKEIAKSHLKNVYLGNV
ncbi:MAG TPA: AmmeMemoRadiSam system radical SAM enzyme [Clostridiaceae bacterium]|jgi:pyruvate formate lyase activating enzyme|nr:AmmeMemoRadiSam system radical SAM enzyme [Clostridiaceae bacterium]